MPKKALFSSVVEDRVGFLFCLLDMAGRWESNQFKGKVFIRSGRTNWQRLPHSLLMLKKWVPFHHNLNTAFLLLLE
jgi:hypothetical protein